MTDKHPGVDVPLRVRYAETDQMGVAYHSNYLVWFEVGRTTYCRRCGVTYADMERQTGAYLPVVEVYCRYREPLRYDQRFRVRTWIEELRTRSIAFGYQIVDEDSGRLLADGRTVHVVTDSSGQPRRLPEEIRRQLARIPENLELESA